MCCVDRESAVVDERRRDVCVRDGKEVATIGGRRVVSDRESRKKRQSRNRRRTEMQGLASQSTGEKKSILNPSKTN